MYLTIKHFHFIFFTFSPEEFKNIMGDISFFKSKRNVTNLLSTLKTQISSLMSKHFEQIIEEENLSELFTKKNALNEEEAKYIILCFISYLLLSLK